MGRVLSSDLIGLGCGHVGEWKKGKVWGAEGT